MGTAQVFFEHFSGLDLVHDQKIGVGQRSLGDGAEMLVFRADEIDAGEQSGGLRGLQHGAGHGAAVFEPAVHFAEQHEVAEMEDFCLRAAEIEVRGSEHGIGTELVKKGAPPGVAHGHGIGVAGGRIRRAVELGGVDACGGAIAQNPRAIRIVADEARGLQRVADAHGGEVFEHVVGAAAVRGGFAVDEGEHVLLGIAIDELDVIDDEIAAGEDSSAMHGAEKNAVQEAGSSAASRSAGNSRRQARATSMSMGTERTCSRSAASARMMPCGSTTRLRPG